MKFNFTAAAQQMRGRVIAKHVLSAYLHLSVCNKVVCVVQVLKEKISLRSGQGRGTVWKEEIALGVSEVEI